MDTAIFKVSHFLLWLIMVFGLAFSIYYRPRGMLVIFTYYIFDFTWELAYNFFKKRYDCDWAQREAYLEIERRRKLGLPLVDPNLIPPERIKLPSMEELGPDFKIII